VVKGTLQDEECAKDLDLETLKQSRAPVICRATGLLNAWLDLAKCLKVGNKADLDAIS
jgi:hypothetical protein